MDNSKSMAFKIRVKTFKTPDDAKWDRSKNMISDDIVYHGSAGIDDVSEIRPDWGVYHKVPTYRKLEKYIRSLGLFPNISENQCVFFGFDGI